MVNYKLLGQRIRVIRQEKGITQEVLAEMADISTPFVSYIECGKKKPSLEILLRIANALGTTADALLIGNQVYESPDYHDIKALLNFCSTKEKDFIIQLIHFVITYYASQ